MKNFVRNGLFALCAVVGFSAFAGEVTSDDAQIVKLCQDLEQGNNVNRVPSDNASSSSSSGGSHRAQ
jgi:hypothetical protein